MLLLFIPLQVQHMTTKEDILHQCQHLNIKNTKCCEINFLLLLLGEKVWKEIWSRRHLESVCKIILFQLLNHSEPRSLLGPHRCLQDTPRLNQRLNQPGPPYIPPLRHLVNPQGNQLWSLRKIHQVFHLCNLQSNRQGSPPQNLLFSLPRNLRANLLRNRR